MAKEELNKEEFKQVSGGMVTGSEIRKQVESDWAGKVSSMSAKELDEKGIQILQASSAAHQSGNMEECARLEIEGGYLCMKAREMDPKVRG